MMIVVRVFASDFKSFKQVILAFGEWLGIAGCVWKAPASNGYEKDEKVLWRDHSSNKMKGLGTDTVVREGRSIRHDITSRILSNTTRVANEKVVFVSSWYRDMIDVSLGKSTLHAWR